MAKKDTPQDKKFPWSKAVNLIKDYFVHSDEKLVSGLFLFGIVICVAGLVAIMFAFSLWTPVFWAAITAKALTAFWVCMGQFALLVSGYVGVSVLKNYLIGKLSIMWRNWLTKKILGQFLNGENNYLDLKRSAELDNVGQRIQEDVKSVVELTLNLGASFLNSFLTLGAFVATLWVVGGPLMFAVLGVNIIIPGYLVWVALIIAIAATVTTHFIAKSLAQTNQEAESAEANLRQNIVLLDDDAENIAIEHAENYYHESLDKKLEKVATTANQKLNTSSKLIAFQNAVVQISSIIPYVAAFPLYLVGGIDLGQLMQVGMSFGEVSFSLGCLVESYEPLTKYQSCMERIIELQDEFENGGIASNPKAIERVEKDKETISIKRLNLMPPSSLGKQRIKINDLNLKLKPGENLLIKGPSGLGKSTLFKAISGNWKYGQGKINIPAKKHLYFLPQKPTLPQDTLMAVLAYPEPVTAYTNEQYIAVLEAVGGMDDYIPRLEESCAWAKELSGGQQQRLSFARAILKKPDWLFLDEATSALDEESEQRVYSALGTYLKQTTFVSIAHRPTVEQYHSKTFCFKGDNQMNDGEAGASVSHF